MAAPAPPAAYQGNQWRAHGSYLQAATGRSPAIPISGAAPELGLRAAGPILAMLGPRPLPQPRAEGDAQGLGMRSDLQWSSRGRDAGQLWVVVGHVKADGGNSLA